MEYDLTLYQTITKQSGKVFTDGTNTWGGLDDVAIAGFKAMADEMNKHWESSKGASGKTYTVSLAGKIVDEHGVVTAAPWDGKRVTYAGVPYSAIRKANKKLVQFGHDLDKVGEKLEKTRHANDHQGGHSGGGGGSQG